MNVEIGAEAVIFPEKEYISGIFFAVHYRVCSLVSLSSRLVVRAVRSLWGARCLLAGRVGLRHGLEQLFRNPGCPPLPTGCHEGQFFLQIFKQTMPSFAQFIYQSM
jgi:hypothetical protein